VKSCIEIFLKISELDQNRDFYEEHFESEFLDDTREYYCREGRQLMEGSTTTGEFLRGASK